MKFQCILLEVKDIHTLNFDNLRVEYIFVVWIVLNQVLNLIKYLHQIMEIKVNIERQNGTMQ